MRFDLGCSSCPLGAAIHTNRPRVVSSGVPGLDTDIPQHGSGLDTSSAPGTGTDSDTKSSIPIWLIALAVGAVLFLGKK